jgi:hypothetical protein
MLATVTTILANPRYTGVRCGNWQRLENPGDDLAAAETN